MTSTLSYIMEPRKYILDRFQEHLRIGYETYCTRHGLQNTHEQLITFLIDQDLISHAQLQRYTVIQEFEKLKSEQQCPKTMAVDTLANRFRLSARTVWGALRHTKSTQR
jgi:hypothetical protein